MRLRKLFLKGFKSFGRPSSLTFSDRITAIVGPNGSGKSNIIDAIKWVFGEQSKKELRASEKFDMIFSGSENLPPSGSAYVELVFEDGDEGITVARELKRTGENTYYLNGVPVRLKDIRDRFAGTGLGVDFYSIVGQGQIDKIVNASPEELRLLLEEAAGISIYREKKKETEVNLERTKLNLDRVKDVLFERERQMKSLYLKAKRAERYKEYSSQLERLRRIYYGNVLKREKRKLEFYQEEERKTNEKIRGIQKELIELETRWSSLKNEFGEMDQEIDRYTKLLEDYKKRQNDLMEMKNLYSSKLANGENKYVEVSTRFEELERRREEYGKRLEEMEYIFKGVMGEYEQKASELSKLEKEKEILLSRFSEKEKEFLKIREEISSIEKQILKLENELLRIGEALEDLKKRKRMAENQISARTRELEEKKGEFKEISKRIEEFDEEERKLTEELNVTRERIEEIGRKIETLSHEIESLEKRSRELQFEKEMIERDIREYRGFSRAVRTVFEQRENFPGLIDVVTNLLEVEEKYSMAISVLLGGMSQNIVVKDVETAKSIVEFLKQNEAGRVTILPLDLIDGSFRKVPGLEKERGFVGYAVDLVKLPPNLEVVAGFLFGNSIVVETLDDAIRVKRKYNLSSRIATLDGELVSGRGAITGGREERTNNVFERRIRLKHIEGEIENIERTVLEKREELASLKTEQEDLKKQETIVQRELFELSKRSSSTKTILSEILRSINQIQEEIQNLEKLLAEYRAKENGFNARRERIFEDIDRLKEQKGILQKSLSEYSEELEKERKALDELNEKIFTLRVEVGSLLETKERYEKEMQDVRKAIERFGEEMDLLRNQLVDLEEEIEKYRRFIREHEREIEHLKKEMDDIFETMKLHRVGKEEKMRELQDVENRMNELKDEKEKLRNHLHQIELAMQESRLKISNVLGEFNGSEKEVEDLPDDKLEEIYKSMGDLENKIKYLGPVDLTAIDEYEKLRGEYEEILKQKEDLEEAKRKLEDIIEKTDREAESLLFDVYQRVNESFNRLISLLFFGGEGRISIISESKSILEAGFEISIRKPGRRDQKLSLLSGGEKALVGIALLFALMEIKPSPFYVLDEVDAPLDDYNAERFKRLLKENSKQTQFVVITHNKIVMEAADLLHGVTMVNGVSAIVPVEIEKILEV
ncbi:chromosome segregation protein SMC [Thermotoga sp. KOL6]|uniref:chromosome segregation protein SMC n=1 Tax=Thermotoga sp. KOL6 TaxID=126741 RepID=UPI000C788E09|nr:chromosome segregation protein SMC [Thermotoga sp. KOL6]PLV59901.1 chromosome segregation protein SMC [Thermotoga sp. KOL6]